MIARVKNDSGKVVRIARGTAVRPATDKMRKLNGKTTWRVVGIDDYNIILKSEKQGDRRTLYFGAPTFLHYWKIVEDEAEQQEKPAIGDMVTPKSLAVSSYYGNSIFCVIGLDDGYVILERRDDSGKHSKPMEWLASSFWVCFERAA